MKNSIYKIILLLNFFLISLSATGQEQFNFSVTEIDILENGNIFIGKDRGVITSNDGIEINADKFEYNKRKNILKASGNVKIIDMTNNYEIYTQNITYKKNNNFIITNKQSKAIDLINGIEIDAEVFKYNLKENIITAENDAIIKDNIKNYKISSNFISYLKSKKEIYTKGKTFAEIFSKYKLESENVTLLIDSMELYSQEKTRITDKLNLYELEKFKYSINKEELKGENILINTNYNLPRNDKFYFKNAIINLNKQEFFGTNPKIKVHKDIFDNLDNDPRIVGISASSNNNVTTVNKGIFTSCKQNENCTPWSIKADQIIHDKNKKEIIYNNALLKIYDFPILYFPKFFHPDPTINRRSGFLKPQINNSNALGSSFSIPYYSVLDENKDLTFTPSIFENNLQMIQNEYREINKNSKLNSNFGFVNNYKSDLDTKKNSIFNLFLEYELDLKLEKFNSSNFFLSVEKVTNDTFLKIFDTHIQDNKLKPSDHNNLKSEVKFLFDNANSSFSTGIVSYENLQKRNNDRYEYVFPYYNYGTTLSEDLFSGTLNFSSSGNNFLSNTNQLKSSVNNNLTFNSKEFTWLNGVKNSFEINTKNLNSIGKNNSEYKSSPQIELMSELNFNIKYPLMKMNENNFNYLTPKVLLKVNPSDMKNYSSLDRTINVNNIFNSNRLGVDDTLETGRSLTLGLDFKKESLSDSNKFFEIKLASVLRDKEEIFIPKNSTINKKNSNLFGSVSNNFSDFFNVKYNFAIDKNLNNIEYNDLNTTFTLDNFTTEFSFLEENGAMGDSNFLENNTSFNLNDNNYITFKTRRNRKLNLTEYYDLVYEYKNDCLTAGIKYKKTYYEDRDLKPSENLFFTISLIPLTNYEQKIDR